MTLMKSTLLPAIEHNHLMIQISFPVYMSNYRQVLFATAVNMPLLFLPKFSALTLQAILHDYVNWQSSKELFS
jgi:hypothetical protein